MIDGYREVALLLSRQPLRPNGDTPWVRNIIDAVSWLKGERAAICSSIGLQTWEMITTVTVDAGLPLILFIPAENEARYWAECVRAIHEFDLNTRVVTFVPVLAPKDRHAARAILEARDRAVISRADLILPVSVRERGSLRRLIDDAESNGKQIMARFETPHTGRHDALSFEIDPGAVREELPKEAAEYIIHWTRSCNTAWPGERLIDYYRAIIDSPTYPRSAFTTLKRILESRKIIASSRHMPRKTATVSFSGLSPTELIPLIKWRARYREMSFEPYGVGIKREVAERLGIKPVLYYEPDDAGSVPSADRWRSQSVGQVTDWRREEEYRHLGNLDLSRVPDDALLAVCYAAGEAKRLQSEIGVRTISFIPS